MDIGRPKRIIEIDPISLPVPMPEFPSPTTEPLREPAPERTPAEPADP
ncbi:MAG: hypothetical protein ABJB55_05915 [Actinomycetota bacterium]